MSKHKPTYTGSILDDGAFKANARKWMTRNVQRDPVTGEVNFTELAENTAHALDHDEWLDEETHWIWDLAVECGEHTMKLWAKLAELKSKKGAH